MFTATTFGEFLKQLDLAMQDTRLMPRVVVIKQALAEDPQTKKHCHIQDGRGHFLGTIIEVEDSIL